MIVAFCGCCWDRLPLARERRSYLDEFAVVVGLMHFGGKSPESFEQSLRGFRACKPAGGCYE